MNPYDDARRLEELYRRFEHALKRSGHLKKGRPDAQADWGSFAKKLGEEFFEEVASTGAANTLLNDPPRKLMAEDLNWRRKRANLTNVVELFVQGVCQVRHSYVHGEKFVSDGNYERDAALVHEALHILLLAETKGIVMLPKPR